MNLKQANEALSATNVRIKRVDGEYRVAFTNGSVAQREASAYYTDSVSDAYGTALAMHNTWINL